MREKACLDLLRFEPEPERITAPEPFLLPQSSISFRDITSWQAPQSAKQWYRWGLRSHERAPIIPSTLRHGLRRRYDDRPSGGTLGQREKCVALLHAKASCRPSHRHSNNKLCLHATSFTVAVKAVALVGVKPNFVQ